MKISEKVRKCALEKIFSSENITAYGKYYRILLQNVQHLNAKTVLDI